MLIFAAIQDTEKRIRLEDLYIKHASCMLKVAHRVLNDEYLAQDAVQDAFLNISNHFEKIVEIDCNKTRALLVIIVRNVAIDIYRKRKKQRDLSYEGLEENIAIDNEGIEEIIITQETLTNIAKTIKKLHTAYADIISLKYFYHYNDAEISQILNITPENVRTRLHRAKHSLINLLLQEQELINDERTRIG